MNRIRVAHFINPFLIVTQNWIYNQLVYNKECEPSVLCQYLQNRDQFPLENVFPVFQQHGLAAQLSMFFSRLRAQYPQAPYQRVIDKIKPNLFHGHFAWESWRNLLLVKNNRLPLVTTFYGQDVSQHGKNPLWQKRYQELFKTGAAFMVEGPCMAQALTALGCAPEKVHVVPLGVDCERIAAFDAAPKKPGEISVLFIGLNREKKGATYAAAAFIAAARKNQSLVLHLIGDGVYRKQLKQMFANANLRDRVVFHGVLPVEKYYGLLKACDILLAPSVTAQNGDTEGGAPVVTIEAAAAGKPVVGSLHADIPSVVLHAKSGLLSTERDTQSLAESLAALAQNAQLRTQMGQAAAAHARTTFNINLQVKAITAVYRKVLA